MQDTLMQSTIHPPTLLGKVCLVTGATSGIGKATAFALAAEGAEVILTGRNQQKAESTLDWIKSKTGNDRVQYLLADYSDLLQVEELAKSFKEQHSRLDVLINNAGAFFNTRRKTELGVEMTFLVNHLAPFFLTNLLVDVIKNSAPARIVNVTSDAYKYGKLNFDDLEFKGFYFGMLAYARSKLANILFTYELARRLEGSGVTVNVLHPGHVATDIWRKDFSIFGPIIQRVIGLFSITQEQAANNILHLVCSQELEPITGEYFVERVSTRTTPITYNMELAKKLWTVSERLTSKNDV
jgi:NAD(P)-dependent dehydrogenase (short-subunit alcohol dehydrogenase family)